jgi:hypothetical protein
LTVLSVEVGTPRGTVYGYFVADENRVVGVGATPADIAERRMRMVDKQPERFGGRPTTPQGWLKVALSNGQWESVLDDSWAEGRTVEDVAAELGERLGKG